MEKKKFILINSPTDYKEWFTCNSRKGGTGYSPCIEGKPSLWEKSTLCNCVGFAWGYEAILHDNKNLRLGGIQYPYTAKYWWTTNDGWSKGSEPKLGAVACWDSTTEKGSGHVGIVVRVYNDGSFDCLESSYNATNKSKYFYEKHYKAKPTRSGLKFQGFKYSPYYEFIGEDEELKVGDKVKLKKLGYVRYIKEIRESHKPNPYLVWNGKYLTGWYKADELEKMD